MSHFAIGVILPENLGYHTCGPHLERILAPFDENLEVEAHPKDCWCVGRESGGYGTEMANKLVGTWDERRALFKAAPEFAALNETVATLEFSDPAYREAEKAQQAAYTAFNADFNQRWEETKYDYMVTLYHS